MNNKQKKSPDYSEKIAAEYDKKAAKI